MASMHIHAPVAGDISNIYSKGINDTMRMYHEMQSDTIFKKFLPEQKAAIMGFCGVMTWKEVPTIWKEVEGTKSDAELRHVLKRHGDKSKKNLNTMFYDVYWSEDLITEIQKVELTESGEATF